MLRELSIRMAASGRSAMADKMSGLRESWKNRGSDAREKAMKTIDEMVAVGRPVNFNSVSKASGISKSFLYDSPEVRARIEEQREADVNKEINRRAKYDKTSRSKDVIIEAKDKRIAKLEAEVRQLKAEVSTLRGMLYEKQ